MIVASPAYLARAGTPRRPAQLAKHACVAFSATTAIADRWSFPRAGRRDESVALRARLATNSGEAPAAKR